MRLLTWPPRLRGGQAGAHVVVLGQPAINRQIDHTGRRDRRTVRLVSRVDAIEAELGVDDIPVLIMELQEAEQWRRGE